MKQTICTALTALLLLLPACRSAYYSTWEKLGWEKRDILVDRVEEARDSQEAAKEQFQTTLERFQELAGTTGGDLQEKYDQLSTAYERSADRAEAVSERIDGIERVGEDLFDEWEEELGQYESAQLRRTSEEQLRKSRDRYQDLLRAMRRSESKMEPVLAAFRDQTLFLKHNLNAQAVASLDTTATEIESDVQTLIQEMEQAIAEADEFISQMRT